MHMCLYIVRVHTSVPQSHKHYGSPCAHKLGGVPSSPDSLLLRANKLRTMLFRDCLLVWFPDLTLFMYMCMRTYSVIHALLMYMHAYISSMQVAYKGYYVGAKCAL